MKDDLIERLADLEHRQWTHWTQYMLTVLEPLTKAAETYLADHCTTDPEDAATAALERWRRQIETPYADLTEKEQNSDRDWARKVLDLLEYPYPAHDGRTHWEGCYKERGHHNCAVVRVKSLEAARYAYATEFSPDEQGDPDVGSIHENIRKLKKMITGFVEGPPAEISVSSGLAEVAGIDTTVHVTGEGLRQLLSKLSQAHTEIERLRRGL